MFGNDFFSAYVSAVENLSPSMHRVVLGGGDLWRFQSKDFPDEFVRLLFPEPGASKPVLPVKDCNGSQKWSYANGTTEPPGRYYTVRNWNPDAAEMTIDFVRHEGGIAAAWAAAASVGDPVGVTTSNGRYRLPAGSSWLLLLSDITGLPAVGRILEERSDEFQTFVHVEVPCEADRQNLKCGATALRWHTGFGLPDRTTRLADIARTIRLPEGAGYIWIAGEAREVSEARKYFRDELGFNKERIDAVGYWIEGQERS